MARSKGLWWLLRRGCGGSLGEAVVARSKGLWWLLCRGCGGSLGEVVLAPSKGLWWLNRSVVVAQSKNLFVVFIS
jgi:hypothetical protein